MSPTWSETVRSFWLASTRTVVGAAAVVDVDPEPGVEVDVVLAAPGLVVGTAPLLVVVAPEGAEGPAVVELARDDVVVVPDPPALPALPPPPHAAAASATSTSATTPRSQTRRVPELTAGTITDTFPGWISNDSRHWSSAGRTARPTGWEPCGPSSR